MVECRALLRPFLLPRQADASFDPIAQAVDHGRAWSTPVCSPDRSSLSYAGEFFRTLILSNVEGRMSEVEYRMWFSVHFRSFSAFSASSWTGDEAGFSCVFSIQAIVFPRSVSPVTSWCVYRIPLLFREVLLGNLLSWCSPRTGRPTV